MKHYYKRKDEYGRRGDHRYNQDKSVVILCDRCDEEITDELPYTLVEDLDPKVFIDVYMNSSSWDEVEKTLLPLCRPVKYGGQICELQIRQYAYHLRGLGIPLPYMREKKSQKMRKNFSGLRQYFEENYVVNIHLHEGTGNNK